MLSEQVKEYMMDDDEPYSWGYMKQKLKDHYGEVIFTETQQNFSQNKVWLIFTRVQVVVLLMTKRIG